MNYEQYHQKGGFYAIPVEIFDGLCEEKDELQKENQKLKEQLKHKQNIINNILDYIDSNIFIEQFENVGNENNVRKEIIKRITNDIEVE